MKKMTQEVPVMDERADIAQEKHHEDNQPNAARHAQFAGDATGRIIGEGTKSATPHETPHQTLSPSPAQENPGIASTTHEDAGWEPEEQGSLLAHEREGVPRGDVPDSIPESTTRTRPKA